MYQCNGVSNVGIMLRKECEFKGHDHCLPEGRWCEEMERKKS